MNWIQAMTLESLLCMTTQQSPRSCGRSACLWIRYCKCDTKLSIWYSEAMETCVLPTETVERLTNNKELNCTFFVGIWSLFTLPFLSVVSECSSTAWSEVSSRCTICANKYGMSGALDIRMLSMNQFLLMSINRVQRIHIPHRQSRVN